MPPSHPADNPTPINNRELILSRRLDAPRDKIFRCWTEPKLLMQWFCPKPWTVSAAVLDVRPGGHSLITMKSPEGQEFPQAGVYLEIVKNERIVFTDAYSEAWLPVEKPFFTGIIELSDEDGKTRYIARGRHWTVEDCQRHAEMGFHDGWGKATDQLEELCKTF